MINYYPAGIRRNRRWFTPRCRILEFDVRRIGRNTIFCSNCLRKFPSKHGGLIYMELIFISQWLSNISRHLVQMSRHGCDRGPRATRVGVTIITKYDCYTALLSSFENKTWFFSKRQKRLCRPFLGASWAIFCLRAVGWEPLHYEVQHYIYNKLPDTWTYSFCDPDSNEELLTSMLAALVTCTTHWFSE